MSLAKNNLLDAVACNQICTAFGVKLVTSVEIVHLAASAGYGSLFIDLEHTTISLREAGQICITALSTGITPFVRVPHQCGDGFIQRVLDMGAMGVIIPHIHTAEDAARAIRISNYPPLGKRSVSMPLPQFQMARVNAAQALEEVNARASTVFIMIETADALANIDSIASLPGCDVLLVGCQDLSMELGVPGDVDSKIFLDALKTVGDTCRKYGRIFGIAGIYTRPDLLELVIKDHGARWIVGSQDMAILQGGTIENVSLLNRFQPERTIING